MNLPPWLVFAALLSLTSALLYQLASRRLGWRVFAYWALTLCGLLIGEAVAESFGVQVTRFGDLRLLPDLAGMAVVISALWAVGL